MPDRIRNRLYDVALVFLLPLASSTAAALSSFEPLFRPLDWNVSGQGLAVADLDGDGDLDAAVPHSGTNLMAPDSLVRLLLNDGDGNFAAAGDLAVGRNPNGVAFADLDGDGKDDLAVTGSNGGRLSLFAGRGDGTFGPRQDLACGLRPTALLVRDLDGDRKQDLVVVQMGNGRQRPTDLEALASGDTVWSDSSAVRVFFAGAGSGRRGQGGFAFRAPIDLVSGVQPVAVAAGDLNGDGRTDLAAACRGSRTFAVWYARQGGFEPAVELASEGGPTDVAIADLDGDGKDDLACLATPTEPPMDRIGIAVGLARPGAALALRWSWIPGLAAYRARLADVDGDGQLDLVTLGQGTIGVARGAGDGSFASPATTAAEAGTAFVVAAIDRGPSLDVLALAPRSRGATLLPGSAGGAFGHGQVLDCPGRATALTSADLDADGLSDLVTADGVGTTLSMYMGRASGDFAPRRTLEFGEGPMFVAAADLDADGDADLVAARIVGSASELAVFRNRGAGEFDPKRNVASGIQPSTVLVADWNGDRILDLLVPRSDAAEVLLYLGRGDASYASAQRLALRHPATLAGAGDLNADGRMDLVAADTRQSIVTVHLGAAGGGLDAAPPFKPRFELGAVAVGDATADGVADLVLVARRGIHAGAVLTGAGDGTFGQRLDFTVGPGAGALTLADLDGDGRLDLVTPDAAMGCISLLPGVATGGFGARRDLGTGIDPSAVAVLDLDRVGKLDLAVAHRGSNGLVLLRNGDATAR
jgi:hypothetical protein